MPKDQPIHIVDAFADRPFAGNPAAVCVLGAAADAEWMQAVAAEMNLAETAFLVPRADPVGDGFDLRWFTPALEVDLCGHATLASAHVLWKTGALDGGVTARFHTRSGLLTAAPAGDWIEMDFPALPVSAEAAPAGLADALGAEPTWLGRNSIDYLLAEIDDEQTIRGLAPDLAVLRKVEALGVIATAPGTDVDYVARFFAPRAGIDEDPVTGSAHCSLAPFWAEKLGKDALVGYQASKRGGTVRVRVAGDRVVLGGQAVTTLRGTLA